MVSPWLLIVLFYCYVPQKKGTLLFQLITASQPSHLRSLNRTGRSLTRSGRTGSDGFGGLQILSVGSTGKAKKKQKQTLSIVWLVVSNIFYCPYYLGSSFPLTNIVQRGWNHQPVLYCYAFLVKWTWFCVAENGVYPPDSHLISWEDENTKFWGTLFSDRSMWSWWLYWFFCP